MVCLRPAHLLALAALLATSHAAAVGPRSLAPLSETWLSSWATMPQLTESTNLPPPPFNESGRVFFNSTLRQTFKISIPGSQFRVRFSNAFGVTNLDITNATVALPAGGTVGVGAIEPATLHTLTFSGSPSFSLPNGAQLVSDPVSLPVAENGVVSVSMFLAGGQETNMITSHPGSRTTTFFTFGDQTRAANITGPDATTAEHWFFISGLEVLTSDKATSAVAIVGDSLTDGRGSTENGNDRWPDQFYDRLRARPHNTIAYLNQAAGGNRILADGLGPNALGRIDRDVLAQTRVSRVIIFEGVNDIGTADATPAAQAAVTAQVIGAFEQIITRVHAAGLPIFGATITPFGSNDPYDDGGLREASRLAVNKWIRTSGAFDAVLDFDAAVRDPKNFTQLDPTIDVGDHLHMTPAGYKRVAAAIPLSLFD
ncbi:SGNH/GDSL hydrolase family protein [Phanerochaete sordida]|uniref:SGNH/GDSL hydrolase family protein n=1 Tax=Phanerochaete sordida TaxID=48140 RepID=A0A9P3GWB0_9APHY|nr:SGNH/GDSL hydrolase family protein [Phanerochaete sordida]